MSLTLKNISAGYGAFHVLHKVNINLPEKSIVALIGPNGAGKSTVLKSIFSIADTYEGSIHFAGKDITQLKTYELLQLGISYVPQGRINFPTLSVKENLLVGASLLKNKDVIAQHLQKVYTQFPVLKKKQHQHAYTLSGGEQQMLALGRALMQEPKVLLLDEPSLGLSPKLVKETFATIKQLAKTGLSILLVEQNAKQAMQIADHTYLLETGKVVLEGKQLEKHPKIKTIYLGGDIDE